MTHGRKRTVSSRRLAIHGALPSKDSADRVAPRAGGLVFKTRITPHWFHQDNRFWYRNDLPGGAGEFIVVDAEHGSRQPAFDHQKLAAGLIEGGRRRSLHGRQASF